MMTASQLIDQLTEARSRTLALVEDLTDEQLMGPRLPIVNPLLWEIGHVAWFQEKWTLRHLFQIEPIREDGDRLYDSMAVAHDTRWDLPLPSRKETLSYMEEVFAGMIDSLHSGKPEVQPYFYQLGLLHEDMHDEAFTYGRQTLSYPPPPLSSPDGEEVSSPQGEEDFFFNYRSQLTRSCCASNSDFCNTLPKGEGELISALCVQFWLLR